MARKPRHRFPVIPSEDLSADAVETLEAVLERAKAGELSSVSIAWTTREGEGGNIWSSDYHFMAQLGSIDRLRHRFNLAQDED